MSNEYKGTIKIKNADGILEPFLPATDVSCIDDANGTSLAQTISNIETQISIAETSGGIELMYEEPDKENTADFSNETLIAYVPVYSWSYTINTQASVSKAKVGAVPLNLYGQDGVSLQVDWGDGNTSTLTPEQYTASDSSASVHTYAAYGTYTITITSYSEWKNVFLFAVDDYAAIQDASDNLTKPLYYWRNTLVKVNSAIPKIAGTVICSPRHGWRFEYSPKQIKYLFLKCLKLTTIPLDLFTKNIEATSFESCFRYCTSIQSIPEGLFDSNAAVTSFDGCFYGCSSLQSIPSGLFDSNIKANDFENCFYDCSSIQSIPSGLFDSNTAAISFNSCFCGCSSLHSIPAGLFDSNTAVTDFGGCFRSCSSIQSIPSGLFSGNTQATRFGNCFYGCISLQSIPSGLFDSNTQATSFQYCFSNCSAIQSIPSGLFDKNTAVTTFFSCFSNCTALGSFTLHISSSLVSICGNFVTKKNGVARKIYVPSNSTTETSFNSVATELGLVIVGE